MSVIYLDGFEIAKDTTISSQPTLGLQTAGVDNYLGNQTFDTVSRTGNSSFKVNAYIANTNQTAPHVERHINVDTSVLVFGFAQRHHLWSDQPSFFAVCNQDRARIIYLQYRETDSKILVYVGTTLVGITNTTFGIDTQWYLQLKILSDATNGYIKLKVGNQMDLDLTNIDTSVTGNKLNQFEFKLKRQASGQQFNIDDMYILDQTAPDNDFLGVCSIIPLRPTANGDRMDFEVIGANSTTEAVDDTTPNTTDYIYGVNVNDKALFVLNDVTTYGNIRNVVVHDYGARSHEGTGSSKYRQILRDASDVEWESSDFTLSSSTFTYHITNLDKNPITDTTWTNSDLNDIQLGVKITQSS